MAERITVKRAAEILGLSELTVRVGIEQKELPIGVAIKVGKKRTNYHISPHLLSQYTGLPIEQLMGDK